jgi:hypothetical protein
MLAELLAEKKLVALMPENPRNQAFSGRRGGQSRTRGGVNLVIFPSKSAISQKPAPFIRL